MYHYKQRARAALIMIRSGKIRQSLHSFTGLLLVLIFLVLSSCPVRNAFFSYLQKAHGGVEQKSTGGTKITAHDMCAGSSFSKIIPSPERISNNAPTVLAAVLFTAFLAFFDLFKKIIHRFFSPPAFKSNPVPIYLRNNVLLI
jgi:hypothetical protein